MTRTLGAMRVRARTSFFEMVFFGAAATFGAAFLTDFFFGGIDAPACAVVGRSG